MERHFVCALKAPLSRLSLCQFLEDSIRAVCTNGTLTSTVVSNMLAIPVQMQLMIRSDVDASE